MRPLITLWLLLPAPVAEPDLLRCARIARERAEVVQPWRATRQADTLRATPGGPWRRDSLFWCAGPGAQVVAL